MPQAREGIGSLGEHCERTRREHSSGGALCHSASARTVDTDTDCLRCAIAYLLRRHRDPAS
ncbi:hypothetical protein JCM4814A_04210 [Streptomyces phaeofaciens JCM 4814]|uniref:Uncharacterized protein n=1 Tax=Streptomyces phaeofaciens TaxID=68254 RepID=A0A918HBG3_9ACTN|nr:hypothetical protein GCM10010226_31580 [Streptomyces phaeofaciens]